MEVAHYHHIDPPGKLTNIYLNDKLIISGYQVYSSVINDVFISYRRCDDGSFVHIINGPTKHIFIDNCTSLDNILNEIHNYFDCDDGTQITEGSALYNLVISAQELLNRKFERILNDVSMDELRRVTSHVRDVVLDVFRDPVMVKSARK